MRQRGTIAEVLGMQPCNHIGWAYSGREQYSELAFQFLSEGAMLGERLMYIAEDPEPDGPRHLATKVKPGALLVATSGEIYGRSGVVDAAVQRAAFAQALADAQAEGFTGLRVAADNTPLVLEDRRLHAWLGWELVADRFMAANPVTGLCAFDRDRVPIDRLRHLTSLHPLSSATSPKPQYRMFVEEDTLRVEGPLDAFGVRMLSRALREIPGYHGVVIDLTAGGQLMSPATLRDLEVLARSGVDIMIAGRPEVGLAIKSAEEHPTLTFLKPPADDTAEV